MIWDDWIKGNQQYPVSLSLSYLCVTPEWGPPLTFRLPRRLPAPSGDVTGESGAVWTGLSIFFSVPLSSWQLLPTWNQFHQHFTTSFSARKSFEQLFSTHNFGLYFLGKRKFANKLLVKCWWNWLLESMHVEEKVKYITSMRHLSVTGVTFVSKYSITIGGRKNRT